RGRAGAPAVAARPPLRLRDDALPEAAPRRVLLARAARGGPPGAGRRHRAPAAAPLHAAHRAGADARAVVAALVHARKRAAQLLAVALEAPGAAGLRRE